MTRKVVSPIALDKSINTTESTPRNIADVLAQQLEAIKTAIETGNGNLEAAFVCYYGVTTATQIKDAIEDGKVPYFYYNGAVAQLWKVETDKYSFRTTNTRSVEGQTILDVVDYVVNGSVWSTVTREVSGGSSSGQSYIASVNSLADFDTTGHSGMESILDVENVPADGVYQVSAMLHITPKTASATKSDLVFHFTSGDGTGWPNHTFHAVVDDSQTFAQQLSFSTSVSLKAGQNTLRIQCSGLNTQYLVFVDELTVAQLVNGVYHNGDDFADVHTLTAAADFNNDDGVLVDGATGGPRFMLWQTLANKVLGFIKSLSTTITAFRTGDVIPVDGPSGTAKMSKDVLLEVTAENAVGVHKTDSGTITASTYNLVSVHAPIGTTLTIKIATSSTVNLVANGSTIIASGRNSGTYQYTTATENTNIGFYLYGASCTYSLDVLYGEVYESIRELQNDSVDIHNEIGNTIHKTGTITTSTYNIAVLSTKVGDVVNVKVDASSSVNLVMNGTTQIAYGITSGVYKFIATSTTTSVGFYLYGASCTYTLDVVAGINIKNDVTELGYTDKNLQNQIGNEIEKTGTITSSTYNIVTIGTKVGDAVNIKITTSSAVNLVANSSTILATSVTSGTYKFVATSTTTNIGFYLYGASCDYTIDVVAGDNLKNEIIELGYVDKNLQSQIGQRVEESGTITASTYNIARISTKVGDLVNIQVNISSSVNLVVNGSVMLAYGITGSHKYQFTATSGTTSVGFYLYGASCNYEIKVTTGSNLNNDISSLEKNVDALGITKTLKTKELLVLGDSISVSTGYFTYLKNYFAKANTIAVAGATWADHSTTDAYNGTPSSDVPKYNVMGNQVQKVKNNSSSYNPDFIILSAGTNDDTPDSDNPSEDLFTHNDSYVSLGTPTFDASDTYMLNRRTIGGAMRYCVTELEKLYPNAKIIVLTPIQASNSLRAYWTTARRQNYISATAHRMASSVVDVGRNCGIYGDFEWQGSSWTEVEPDSREGRDLRDGLHPNDTGRKKMSDYIFSQICTMVS